MSKETTERAIESNQRVPLHEQKVLKAEARPGWVRYWAPEVQDTIDAMMKAGWVCVQGDSSSTHSGKAHIESNLGSVLRRVVNPKSAHAEFRTAILMEIPEEYYKADYQAQQKMIDDDEARFDKAGVHKAAGMYGHISREHGGRK